MFFISQVQVLSFTWVMTITCDPRLRASVMPVHCQTSVSSSRNCGVSPPRALGALVFLVVIHKLEYFLNSKIIGDRIKNPIWLTLLGLILGEKLMGIPGMILAPVILNYVKVEASKIEAAPPPEK